MAGCLIRTVEGTSWTTADSHNLVSMENIIASKEIQVERKQFSIEFRENDRGQFLRITEEAHGRRNTVIIPSTGLEDFTTALADVLSEISARQ